MAREIERKFLVANDAWRTLVERSEPMSQGYIASGERVSVRVRIARNLAWLNIKSGGLVASRLEYEYAIPIADARELLEATATARITKTRHFVHYGSHEWEIDEFHGENSGLVVAEIELTREDESFDLPSWLGAEVTQHARYYNVCLVKHPYRAWSEVERRP